MPPVEIHITLVDGRLKFGSSTQDKVLLLGMLEMAKALALKQEARPAVEAPGPALAQQLLRPPEPGRK